MFHFNKKSGDGFMNQLLQRHQEKQAVRKKANQQMMNDVLERMDANQNIAAYFNRQSMEYAGYVMTIWQSDVELAHPLSINRKMIEQIQQSDGVFLEGYAQTANGFVKDVYDSAYPDEIMCENCGRSAIITTEDLVHMEEERRARKMVEQARKMPKTTVVYKDDVADIPMMNPGKGSGRR